ERIDWAGVTEERVQVVRPGVDRRIFRPVGTNPWRGRPANQAPKILFAGRMQRYKGPHVLLEALAVLRDRGLKTLPVAHFTGAASGSATYDVQIGSAS